MGRRRAPIQHVIICRVLGRNSTRVSCVHAAVVVCNTRALPAFPLFGGTSPAHTHAHTHTRTRTCTHTRAAHSANCEASLVLYSTSSPSRRLISARHLRHVRSRFLIDPPRPAAAHSYYYFPAHNNKRIFFLPLILRCFFIFIFVPASGFASLCSVYIHAPRGPESFLFLSTSRARVGLVLYIRVVVYITYNIIYYYILCVCLV